MAKLAGGILRTISTLLYFLEFCCTAIILGIYSYFLAKLSLHHLGEKQEWRAVEGLAGAAVLYTIFAVLLTCCLGGMPFFAFLAILLDVLFCGAMIAIAIMTREGDSCGGDYVRTPLGNGSPNTLSAAGTHLHFACRLNQVAFAVSIIAAFLFAISVLMQIAVARHHQKEKKYGPSPANNYTSGSGNRKFWRRRTKHDVARDVEMSDGAAVAGTGAGAGAGLTAPKPDLRHSQETGYTGSTMGQGDVLPGKYDPNNHAGYSVHPTGTAVANPYGYQAPGATPATTTAATNY